MSETRLLIIALSAVLATACGGGGSASPPPVAQHTDKPAAAPGFDFVGGLALRAKDPKALARWYTDRFGLAIKMEFPGGVAGGFESGTTQFNIAIVDAEGKHPGAAPGTGYFVLHVNDFDRVLAAITARGVAPFDHSSDEMGRFASFHDPEGNEVGIWGK